MASKATGDREATDARGRVAGDTRAGEVSDLRAGMVDDTAASRSQAAAVRPAQLGFVSPAGEHRRLKFWQRFRKLYAIYADAGANDRAALEYRFVDKWTDLVDEYERDWPGYDPPLLYFNEQIEYQVRWPTL